MLKNILGAIFHNVGVTAVSFIFGGIGLLADRIFNLSNFQTALSIAVGAALLLVGFAIRAWATYLFYGNKMHVIDLVPQRTLITTGPFAFSRHPLYLGGNVCMFLGACLMLGTPGGIVLTVLHWPVMDLMARREERQLKAVFGEEWLNYKKGVRRWI